jgi:large subunit ribosomal protein L15
MNLHELPAADGVRREKRRVGRGHGSGRVKTSGRGTKGQNSRSGGGTRLGFEGGQNPWTMRVPHKRGFNIGRFRKTVQELNLGDLNAFDEGQNVTLTTLLERRMIDNTKDTVKLLGGGTLSKKLIVEVHQASQSARSAVEAAGGTITLLREPKPKERKAKAKAARPAEEQEQPGESQSGESQTAE